MYSSMGYWLKRLLTCVLPRDVRQRITGDFRHAARKRAIRIAEASDGSRSNVFGEHSGLQRRPDRLGMVLA
jgi:hypothetical protein